MSAPDERGEHGEHGERGERGERGEHGDRLGHMPGQLSYRRQIFEQLFRIADSVAASFGRNCEVAVHDFADMEHSLAHIAGNVTRRQVGAPITDLVLKALRAEGNNAQDIHNYQSMSRDGRVLKSSTTFIRDESGQIIGAFCTNLDITEFQSSAALLQDLIATTSLQPESAETFAASVDEAVEVMVRQTAETIGKPPVQMDIAERIRFVAALEEKGAFLIRGSVQYAASILGVSKYTVYNYLQKVRAAERLNVV